MKIGLLCNFYGFPHYLDDVIKEWLAFKSDEDSLVVAINSCKYEIYNQIGFNDEDTETLAKLQNQYSNFYQFLNYGEKQNDATARNKALKFLLEQDCDYIWLLDGDEIYSATDIANVVSFVKKDPYCAWFRVNFKNYVNDQSHWISGFCPPRVFRVNYSGNLIDRFYYENDLIYKNAQGEMDYKSLSSREIPNSLAFIKHYSWCGTPEFLQRKIQYQNLHYGGICSYKFQDGQLVFNDEYYSKLNLPKPEIYNE